MNEKARPALWAAHAETARGNTALVDLIGSFASLAFHFEHAAPLITFLPGLDRNCPTILRVYVFKAGRISSAGQAKQLFCVTRRGLRPAGAWVTRRGLRPACASCRPPEVRPLIRRAVGSGAGGT